VTRQGKKAAGHHGLPARDRAFQTDQQAADFALVLKATTPADVTRVVSVVADLTDDELLLPEQLDLAGDVPWPIAMRPTEEGR
jgi:hypothetical protein